MKKKPGPKRKIDRCPVCRARDSVKVICTQTTGYVRCFWIHCRACNARGQYIDTDNGPYPVRIRPAD